jgi:transglutaminase-like putative cysteine protease
MRLEKVTQEQALATELGLADVVALTSIPSGVEDGFLSGRESVRVQLSGVDLSPMDLEVPGQTWVSREAGVLEIRRTEAPKEPVAFPVTDPEYAEWLTSSPYVQSDDPKILAAAQGVVQGAPNAWEAARRLQAWVHQQVRKNPVLSMPSALDALETLEGDCYEHTTLFVAMARSVGIPAEICVGLGHVRGRYCYHAWPRVFVGNWVAMDPTFGQDIADVGHICLASGDLSKQLRLVKVLGRLEIKVLE